MKLIISLIFILTCFTFSTARADIKIDIQVFSIHSSRIEKLILSTEDGDQFSKTIRPPHNYNPLETLVPLLTINSHDFSQNIERFLLEVFFTNGTIISFPLLFMRPVKNEIRDIRVSGKLVAGGYSKAITRATDILTKIRAYESYSLCKSYFNKTRNHPSFRISAAICWLKANRSMALATKPKYMRTFNKDFLILSEMKKIINLIEDNSLWRTALNNSDFPSTTVTDMQSDLDMLELSYWRLFNLKHIEKLDEIYGNGHSCNMITYFKNKLNRLNPHQIELILSDSIRINQEDIIQINNSSCS